MEREGWRGVEGCEIEVDQRMLNGEGLPFGNDAFDCVVSSWTLCSIEHVDQALAEVHRVLKRDGRFLFIEHGLSREPGIQKWQRRLNWLEMRLAGGCRLDRTIKAIVTAQPFSSLTSHKSSPGIFPNPPPYI